MPLDPDVRAILNQLQASGRTPLHLLTPEQAREQRRLIFPPTRIQLGSETSEDLALTGPDDVISARLYRPTNARLPAVLFFHGGGWVLGDLDSHDLVCREIAVRANTVVLSIAYRLAPEHRFPAAVNDAWHSLMWLRQHARELDVDSGRIALCGDSAGGNLAAVVAQRARDAGIGLRLQALIYPVLDCDLSRASYVRNGKGFGLETAYMTWYWDHYVPDPPTRLVPEASPLRAPDLRGLARTHIIVGEYDPLRDEGVAYARRLRSAGVRVRLDDLDGLNHGFLSWSPSVRRADAVYDKIAAELADAFELEGAPAR